MAVRSLVLLLVASAGCSFEGAPASLDPDATDLREEVVDTDFAAGSLVSTAVAEPGVIEPAAYAVGGLRVRAYDGYDRAGRVYYMQPNQTFAQLEEALASFQRGAAYYRTTEPAVRGDPPPHLGVSNDNWVLLYDGEVELEPGERTFSIDADDVALVEIGPPEAPIATLYSEYNDSVRSVNIEVPPGMSWMPIRIAHEDISGDAYPDLKIDGAFISPERLRVRINDHRGVHMRAAREYYSHVGEAVVPDIDDLFRDQPPELFPATGGDHFGLRYVGQLYADEGTYELRIVVNNPMDEQARIRIDGELVQRIWYGTVDAPVPTLLTAGWHDLIVDYSDRAGPASVRLEMRRVGDPNSGFTVVPGDRLRPIAAVGTSSFVFDPNFNAEVSLGASVTKDFTVGAPSDATIEWSDLMFEIDPPTMADLNVTATDCATYPVPLRAARVEFFEGNESCRGQRPMPVTLTFTAISGSRTVRSVGVATSYHGGDKRPPYAAAAIFESKVLDTTGATALLSLEVTGDPRGGRIHAYVRSGDASTAEWVEVGSDGAIPEGTSVGDQTQYRIVMETDGWARSTVQSVKLAYARPRP